MGVVIYKQMCFEGIYYIRLRKLLKNLLKKKKKLLRYKRIRTWIFLKSNYPISKKSKNSRMGKGKGSFIRWVTKLNRGFILLEFFGVNFLRLKSLNKQLTYILGSKTCILNKTNIF
jgi:hypothetical protein